MSDQVRTPKVLRGQRDAAAFAALALADDSQAANEFLAGMDVDDLAILAWRLAGWFGAELSSRLERQRCLTQEESYAEAMAYLRNIAGLINERLEEARIVEDLLGAGLEEEAQA
jgi:hypothetical protein